MKVVSDELKQAIIKFIGHYEEFKNFDFKRIKKICVFDNDNTGFVGQTKPLNVNGHLEFEILLHTSVIKNISDEKYRAIILHEFFHCKEMLITSQYINWKEIYFSDNHTKTSDIILEFGYYQLSEYYAYYNCSKYSQRNISLDDFVNKANISLIVLTRSENPDKIWLYPNAKTNIENLASHLVILIAQYAYSMDEKYISEIEKFNITKYKNLYIYMKMLLTELPKLYQKYSTNISEAYLMEFGKLLYSMIHNYGLQYRTEDLSDNFILKLIQ